MKSIKSLFRLSLCSAISSVMTFGMNLILLRFSSTAAAVFGIYFKLNSFIFMPIFGLNNGMVPIIAYNYGARKRLRINRAIRLSAVAAHSSDAGRPGSLLCDSGTAAWNL